MSMELEANGSGVALFPRNAEDPPPARTRCATSRSAPRGEGWTRQRPSFALAGVAFEERDYGVAWSIYMPDPDGHLVEITTDEVTRD